MPQIDVYQQLQERFALPLEAPQRRRIVSWHDAAGEFEDDFRQIASKGLIDVSGDAVECISVDDGSVFEAKRHITRECADASFLLYRKRNRGAVDGDWLADIELYA